MEINLQNFLWLITYETQSTFPLEENLLVKALSVGHAKDRLAEFLEQCNYNCDEFKILDYIVKNVELYDERIHAPIIFYETID